jgi:putative tryptophan/tyrosine transport system substrate-binding protein
MKRRNLIALLGGAAVAAPLCARAQPPPGIPRIGVLMGATPSVEAAKLGTFREALKQLGYIDGQTILIEPRYAESEAGRLGVMARELVALTPAVIVCVGRQETVALQAATHTIPIVFIQVSNPVEMGLVDTLARPGGNTTGFTQMSADLDSKRLELLHEIAPSVSRAAFLVDPVLTADLPKRLANAEAAARTLGIALRRLDAATPAELAAALATIDASAGEALLVQNDPLLTGTERPQILDFAAAHRLPTVFEGTGSVALGGLLRYGPNLIENARLAAGYVDKILKGAKPADLPVQQPTRFELVINLTTAKALGLTIPPLILARADEVIE